MKALRIINLCLVSVLLVILILIGTSLVMTTNKKEEQKKQRPIEQTLIQTPLGTISVLREGSEQNEESDFSSDGHFVLRLGSYRFELGFNAGKEEETQPQAEESEKGFFERISENVHDTLGSIFGTE